MAFPLQLGVQFTPAELATMKAAAQTITSTIISKMDFNMGNEEREELSKVGDERAPFVIKSVADYGVTYPNLNGQAYTHLMASMDLGTYAQMFEVLTVLKEAVERTEEMQMVAGHFCFEFMRDQYDNAKKYRSKNVAGAQVVYDGLKDCFEQSTQNPVPPKPDPIP
ncbi:MAG: hypothetical protein K9J06_08405 [Flavobacteriales bacterium]|nr:hypothetical protein [Flavobacteriales bacterium]